MPGDARAIADRDAVSQLCKAYALAVDTRDEEMLRSLFDPKAPMIGTLSKGVAEDYLGRLLQGLEGFSATMHSILNQYIVIDGDEGQVRSYAVAYHVRKPEDDGGLMVMGIHYRDSVKRTQQGWWISGREVVRIFDHGQGVPPPTTPPGA
jgi:hypothetical protein